MPEFSYTELLPLGQDTTDYRQVSADGTGTRQAFGKTFLEIDPGVLSLLTETAMRDIAHLLRPGHLRQLRVEVLEYSELGMEAVWKIEVRDFPAFIVVDDKGNDFFADVTTARQPLLSIGSAPS